MLWKGFQRPKRLEFERETLTDRFGRFYAQPFERGFRHDDRQFAAARAALLNRGRGITAVKIEGVLHEFSPIPGVVEDATDIILNLKQVPLKMHTDTTKTLYLRVEKAGEVKARDIQTDGDVEILEPDARIATVSEGGKLHMEMRLKRGRGYISADKNFDEDLGIGWIPIDSVHSPVKKVNYLVEAARLGQTTDYDKLTVDIWTNGSITPRDAISLSAKLVRDHLNIFINLDESSDEQSDAQIEQQQSGSLNENLDKSVEELELSVRSYNCLKNANIRTNPRARAEDRGGDAEDEELRPQVPQRDQGNPAEHGLEPGHAGRSAGQPIEPNKQDHRHASQSCSQKAWTGHRSPDRDAP
jgi:DNA-directed RNA polymerase subunit alpha